MPQSQVDFLGIGAQKAGTSWLHKNLQQHPEIWMPPRKELHYFDRSLNYPSPSFLASDEFTTRINSLEPHNVDFKNKLEKELKIAIKSKNDAQIQWYLKYFLGTYSDEWYHSLFEEGKDKVSGEITPSYSFLSREEIGHIYSLYPKLKIILILRNPIDRAWSHLRFHIRLNKFSTDSSLEPIKEFIDSEKQVLRGDYLSILSNWSSIFPKEQIHVCFYDDIEENPQSFLDNIFNFLEVSSLEIEKTILNTKVNVSASKKIPPEIEAYLIEKYQYDIEKLSQILNHSAIDWLRQTSKSNSLQRV